jgi:hypothetical protein
MKSRLEYCKEIDDLLFRYRHHKDRQSFIMANRYLTRADNVAKQLKETYGWTNAGRYSSETKGDGGDETTS